MGQGSAWEVGDLGVARGEGRRAESAAPLGRPWAAGRGRTQCAPLRPHVALVTRTLPNNVSLPTGPPCRRGEGCARRERRALVGRCPWSGTRAPARCLGEALAGRAHRRCDRTGGARLGPGRGSEFAPPAQPPRLSWPSSLAAAAEPSRAEPPGT